MKNQDINDKIWVGRKDLNYDNQFIEESSSEFKEVPMNELEKMADYGFNSSRRDFLKVLGFGIGAATIASCDIPVKKAIPYVVKPEEIVPGVANYYASSFVKGGDYCSVLVKTREGRPIKIEGNKLSGVTFGGTSARAQAEVLSLYNFNRIKEPQKNNGGKFESISWKDLDNAVSKSFDPLSNIRIVTNTILSPTRKNVIKDFLKKFPKTKVITYDPVSSAAILIANERNFGKKEIPDYKFDKADVIVSFGADFLGTWISPIEYSKKYAENRKIKDVENPKMSRHIQVESFMSMTGSNADNRVLIKPSEMGSAVLFLYNEIAKATGGQTFNNLKLNDKAKSGLQKVAAELIAARGKSIVVCGSNDINEQILINKINSLLGNYNITIDFSESSMQRQGDERDMTALISDMNSGIVNGIIFLESNPLFDYAGKASLKSALAKVKTKIALTYSNDETTSLCDFVAPVSHTMESWGDAMPKKGHFSLIQPTISTIFNTRQAEISLLKWCGLLDETLEQPYYTYLKNNWNSLLGITGNSWDKTLKDGVLYKKPSDVRVSFSGDVQSTVTSLAKPSEGLDLVFFEPINLGNGQYGENPWLYEMPNPVDRTVWGNHLYIPVHFDGDKNFNTFNDLEDGDIIELTTKDKKKKPVVVSVFGQAKDSFAISLGYGRENAGLVGTGIGIDVNDLLMLKEGLIQYYISDIQLSNKVGKDEDFAYVQYHHTIGVTAKDKDTGVVKNADESALPDSFWKSVFGVEGFQGALTDRSVIFKSNIKDLKENVEKLKEKRTEFQQLNSKQIYNGFDDLYSREHHWGMHIDTNLCIGCGTCTIACMSENNVPVVGKHEVHRHHEMSWLRIDRYFYGEVDNPGTVYEPMLCQHCDNAPCENVCPVNATNHSSEGLNQMVYNRCIGTRYCANNCPYKVRRFNWLDYAKADIFYGNEPALRTGNKFSDIGDDSLLFGTDPLTRLVLNPDVTVRSRGVIEKCSFCVQRIQESKLKAKVDGRKLNDGDIVTACQGACPTNAITFGDMNDKESSLMKNMSSPLSFIALEETNVRSSVTYSMKVNNRNEKYDI